MATEQAGAAAHPATPASEENAYDEMLKALPELSDGIPDFERVLTGTTGMGRTSLTAVIREDTRSGDWRDAVFQWLDYAVRLFFTFALAAW